MATQVTCEWAGAIFEVNKTIWAGTVRKENSPTNGKNLLVDGKFLPAGGEYSPVDGEFLLLGINFLHFIQD